ncbi:MAG: hypothetical protein ACPGVG_16290 [Mycobacterium sp.]
MSTSGTTTTDTLLDIDSEVRRLVIEEGLTGASASSMTMYLYC